MNVDFIVEDNEKIVSYAFLNKTNSKNKELVFSCINKNDTIRSNDLYYNNKEMRKKNISLILSADYYEIFQIEILSDLNKKEVNNYFSEKASTRYDLSQYIYKYIKSTIVSKSGKLIYFFILIRKNKLIKKINDIELNGSIVSHVSVDLVAKLAAVQSLISKKDYVYINWSTKHAAINIIKESILYDRIAIPCVNDFYDKKNIDILIESFSNIFFQVVDAYSTQVEHGVYIEPKVDLNHMIINEVQKNYDINVQEVSLDIIYNQNYKDEKFSLDLYGGALLNEII